MKAYKDLILAISIVFIIVIFGFGLFYVLTTGTTEASDKNGLAKLDQPGIGNVSESYVPTPETKVKSASTQQPSASQTAIVPSIPTPTPTKKTNKNGNQDTSTTPTHTPTPTLSPTYTPTPTIPTQTPALEPPPNETVTPEASSSAEPTP